jgi:hypothetical protein
MLVLIGAVPSQVQWPALKRPFVTIGVLLQTSGAYDCQSKRRVRRQPTGGNMKHLAYAVVAAAVLAGCGGGGPSTDAGSASASTPGVQPPQKLGAYFGTWSSDCANHAVDTATIVNGAWGHPEFQTDVINITIRTDYYNNANCTGNIIATVTPSTYATAMYVDSANAPVVLTPGAPPVTVKVDKVSATLSAHTVTVSGSAVTHTVMNGQAQWCIDYGGNSTCLKDEGTYPAQGTSTGGLYLQGSTLYELELNGSVYTVDERFTKQ